MKKIVAIVVLMMAATLAFSQGGARMSKKAPIVVQQAFMQQNPGAKAKWVQKGANYEAAFKQGGQKMRILYDATGGLIKTETDVKPSILPADITSYIATTYKSKAKKATQIINNKGVVTYRVTTKGKKLNFDSNGKFISEVPTN